jgi:hypothetical protein
VKIIKNITWWFVKIRVKTLRLQSVRPTEYYWQCESQTGSRKSLVLHSARYCSWDPSAPYCWAGRQINKSRGATRVSKHKSLENWRQQHKSLKLLQSSVSRTDPWEKSRCKPRSDILNVFFLLITGIYLLTYLFNDTVNSSDYTVPNYRLN